MLSRIKHNATTSPLLRIPYEIREKIHRELVGDRLLHIDYNHWQHAKFDANRNTTWADPGFCKDCRITCVSCLQSPTFDVNRSFNLLVESTSKEGCIQACTQHLQPAKRIPFYDEPYSPKPWPWPQPIVTRQPNHRALNRTVLRCCRQLYNECNQVLWTSNVYSFTNIKVFLMFMNLHRSCLPLLRNLQLHIVGHIWEQGTNIIRSMRGLTSLDLTIADPGLREHYAHQMMIDPVVLYDDFSFPLHFRIWPLRHVRVTLEPRGRTREDSRNEQDREAIARILQEGIADPNGFEAHSREHKKYQERVQARKLANLKEAEARRAERQRRRERKVVQ